MVETRSAAKRHLRELQESQRYQSSAREEQQRFDNAEEGGHHWNVLGVLISWICDFYLNSMLVFAGVILGTALLYYINQTSSIFDSLSAQMTGQLPPGLSAETHKSIQAALRDGHLWKCIAAPLIGLCFIVYYNQRKRNNERAAEQQRLKQRIERELWPAEASHAY